jgi:hypothetical protein
VYDTKRKNKERAERVIHHLDNALQESPKTLWHQFKQAVEAEQSPSPNQHEANPNRVGHFYFIDLLPFIQSFKLNNLSSPKLLVLLRGDHQREGFRKKCLTCDFIERHARFSEWEQNGLELIAEVEVTKSNRGRPSHSQRRQNKKDDEKYEQENEKNSSRDGNSTATTSYSTIRGRLPRKIR